MTSTRIEALKNEYIELVEFFRSTSQITFEMNINNSYKKNLLLSVASYFEALISEIIIAHIKAYTKNDDKIVALVRNKAINRQYHALFDWDSTNANKFFSLFGDTLKAQARKLILEKDLLDAEKAFLTIGKERNKLVHQNYVEAIIDNTFDEIYAQYELACDFVELIRDILPDK